MHLPHLSLFLSDLGCLVGERAAARDSYISSNLEEREERISENSSYIGRSLYLTTFETLRVNEILSQVVLSKSHSDAIWFLFRFRSSL